MKEAIALVRMGCQGNNMWLREVIEGANFQSRFDKSTAQAEQMKEGALRLL